MTLTLKSSDAPLSQSLARLRSSFRKLRLARDYRALMTGGIYFVELTRNSKTHQWHPHLHILFEGRYIHQPNLKERWLQITGDSHIVDVRKIPNSGMAAAYMSKYAGKPLAASIIGQPDAFDEAIEALAGTKTFHVFGTWRDLGLSKPDADNLEWLPLMPLADCIERATAGDAFCRSILARLKGGNADEPMDYDGRDTS
jgi:hypothetical protein